MNESSDGPLIGLIVNPIAGLGGKVGLKGSDGEHTQQRALALGGKGCGVERATLTLRQFSRHSRAFSIVTCQGDMGEHAVAKAGLVAQAVLPIGAAEGFSASDTVAAARWMFAMGVKLILFAGGDGTARNIMDAVGSDVLVLGIPAGVKVQSAVFAINPVSAAEIVRRFVSNDITGCTAAEVMDLDEEELRQQRVSARLYGYLNIPDDRSLTQSAKSRSKQSDRGAVCAIADEVKRTMNDETLYIIGPGMTTSALKERLEISGSLIGVDIVKGGKLICRDASEQDILATMDKYPGPSQLMVTCIGGQGFLLGRGNPQISSEVLTRIGCGRITVLATTNKLTSLRGRPLLVDTGSPWLDKLFNGYIPVITGFRERLVYRVASSLA